MAQLIHRMSDDEFSVYCEWLSNLSSDEKRRKFKMILKRDKSWSNHRDDIDDMRRELDIEKRRSLQGVCPE